MDSPQTSTRADNLQPAMSVNIPQLPPPAPFDFSNPQSWERWSQRFEDYRRASGLHRADSETQLRTLLYVMGEESRGVLGTLSISAEQRDSYDAVMQGFQDHFVHPTNEVYESVRFLNRIQEPGESVDAFFTALRKMVKKCNYESVAHEDRLVRDKFVSSLRDRALVDRLCRSPKLYLQDARLQARIHEDAEREQALLFSRESAVPRNEVCSTYQEDHEVSEHNEVVVNSEEGVVTPLIRGEARP